LVEKLLMVKVEAATLTTTLELMARAAMRARQTMAEILNIGVLRCFLGEIEEKKEKKEIFFFFLA